MGLTALLRHDCSAAERGFADRQHRQRLLHSRYLHRIAARHEADLGSEQPVGLEGSPDNGQPVPQGTIIVGIDGGYVRNWYDKKRNFEVGKSMATGRNDRYFGLVSSQDERSDRRLRAVLQDLPGTPAITMLVATACALWRA